MNTAKWIEKNTASLEGKTVALSGSTGGIGREICFYLVSLGADLVLIDRNIKKSRALALELRGRREGVSISHVKADMENIDEVIAAADELSSRRIDYLILNAGAYSIPRHKCDSGYDNVFQINFLSQYYLARRLLPLVSERGGKVVAVSSIAHNYSRSDADDIDFSTRTRASLVYGNAKRYLTYSLLPLDNVSIAHPGITPTGITAHYPKLIYAIIKYPMRLIFMKPRKAALSIIAALFSDTDNDEWIGPRLFNVWGYPNKKKLRTASPEEAERIFGVACEIYQKFTDK